MRTLVIAAALLTGISVAAAKFMTVQQYHKEKGPCACPDDKDEAGHRCGRRSAFCEKADIEIKNCYAKDVERRKKKECLLHWDGAF
jgi:hypothetical protein